MKQATIICPHCQESFTFPINDTDMMAIKEMVLGNRTGWCPKCHLRISTPSITINENAADTPQ